MNNLKGLGMLEEKRRRKRLGGLAVQHFEVGGAAGDDNPNGNGVSGESYGAPEGWSGDTYTMGPDPNAPSNNAPVGGNDYQNMSDAALAAANQAAMASQQQLSYDPMGGYGLTPGGENPVTQSDGQETQTFSTADIQGPPNIQGPPAPTTSQKASQWLGDLILGIGGIPLGSVANKAGLIGSVNPFSILSGLVEKGANWARDNGYDVQPPSNSNDGQNGPDDGSSQISRASPRSGSGLAAVGSVDGSVDGQISAPPASSVAGGSQPGTTGSTLPGGQTGSQLSQFNIATDPRWGFDEQFYLNSNPDVQALVNSGQFTSGQQHYENVGRLEGRKPLPHGNAGQTLAAGLQRYYRNLGATQLASGGLANISPWDRVNADTDQRGLTPWDAASVTTADTSRFGGSYIAPTDTNLHLPERIKMYADGGSIINDYIAEKYTSKIPEYQSRLNANGLTPSQRAFWQDQLLRAQNPPQPSEADISSWQFMRRSLPQIQQTMQGRGYASGGLNVQPSENPQHMALGTHVRGPGDGRSDNVPAMLSNDEFVIPADVVAAEGDGSSNAGAKRLSEYVVNKRKEYRNHLSRLPKPKV